MTPDLARRVAEALEAEAALHEPHELYELTDDSVGLHRDRRSAELHALAQELREMGEENARLRERDALLTYLFEACSYSYGGDSVSSPTPPEFGISWERQATTPERPTLYEQLSKDAAEFYRRFLDDADPEEEPDSWLRDCAAKLAALESKP